MPEFSYRLRDKEGKLIEEGIVEGVSKEEVTSLLQKRGFLVTDLRQRQIKPQEEKLKPKKHLQHHRITHDDLLLFARQLSILLDAGVTLLRSLKVISNQTESKGFHRVLTEVEKNVENGATFHNALAKHPKVFSEFWVNLIETGEASGQLVIPLQQIGDYLETTRSFQKKIVSALVYPVILGSIATVAVFIFTFKLVPVFENIFNSFGVKIPLLTGIIISLSRILRRFFLFAIIIIGGLIYLIRRYVHTDRGRRRLDQLKIKLPLIDILSRDIIAFRFCSSLNMLLKSGVPILIALEVAKKAVGNKLVEEALEKIRTEVRDGKPLAGALDRSTMFVPMVVQMVGIGEEVGEIDRMLEKVSKFYEEQVTTTVTRLASLFEPLMLVFMGVVIGVLVISMFLPIFKLATISMPH